MNNPKHKEILSKIEDYIDWIENLTFDKLMNISITNQKKISHQNLSSNNIENIETGISGYLLFLLEFYRYSNEDSQLLKIRSFTNDTILYCKNTQTSNYSLYTGRGGFVYFLLQLYAINKDESLLNDCIELIKPCGREYLESTYTSDYLYNGRAGTLLVLLELYQVTNSNDIFSLINQYSLKIAKNGLLSEEGISWKVTEEINLKNSCGFALGSSGILYVLRKLNSCFPNKAIEYIINNIQKQIENCWDEEVGNWQNYEKDIISKEIFNLYRQQYKNKDELLFVPNYDLCWAKGKVGVQLSLDTQNVDFKVSEIRLNDLPNNIYDGISGIGLCLLINPNKNADVLLTISEFLLNQNGSDSLEGGLLLGDLGRYYFLLKFISDKNEVNIINPSTLVFEKSDIKLLININDVKKSLLKKYFNRTIAFLENIAPASLNSYLSSPKISEKISEITYFQNFIENELVIKKDTSAYGLLNDVYCLEKEKKEFSESDNRANLQIYLDTIFHNEEVLKLLNNSDEWIFNQQIRISDSIKLVNSKWDWVSRENFNFVENFYNLPNHYEYLFLNSIENRVIEYSLKVDGLVLHRFDSGNTIKQAIQDLKYYCQSQPPEAIEAIAKNTGSKDVEDFINRLDFLVSHKVKQLIYDGILEIIL